MANGSANRKGVEGPSRRRGVKMMGSNNSDNIHFSMHIEASCPECGNEPQNIEYWNCGPIVRILCPKCRFVCNEREGYEKGYVDIFDYWNQLSPNL